MKFSSIRTIVFIWLAWVFIVIGFQALATARFSIQFPDNALEWTTSETGPGYQQGQPYLLEPFMNDQVAWDSEYYLAIAVGGYDDPATDLIGPPDHQVTKSYAFFPLYPFLMRLMAFPLRVFGMNPIATATLAGVIVSALGALGAMLALYDLTRDLLGEEGALRAAFYLIIFPTGFFLVQVYTEAVFVGFSFGCLAMLKRRNWFWAAVLGSCATMTRAVGVAIVVPMLMAWVSTGEWMDLDLEWRQIFLSGFPLRTLWRALLVCMPLITFLVWKFSYYGLVFDFVEANFFGSRFMDLGRAVNVWSRAWQSLFLDNPERAANFLIVFGAFGLALLGCIKNFKAFPELTGFSLAVLFISWGSGPPSGMDRYILSVPATFIVLAQWGKNPVFDRAWTVLSVLLMGLLAMLFAFNFWVA